MKKLERLNISKFKKNSIELSKIIKIKGGECVPSGCQDSTDHLDVSDGIIDGNGGGDCCETKENLSGSDLVLLDRNQYIIKTDNTSLK